MTLAIQVTTGQDQFDAIFAAALADISVQRRFRVGGHNYLLLWFHAKGQRRPAQIFNVEP